MKTPSVSLFLCEFLENLSQRLFTVRLPPAAPWFLSRKLPARHYSVLYSSCLDLESPPVFSLPPRPLPSPRLASLTTKKKNPNATSQAPPISDCNGVNPEWVELAMPWAAHQKKACPTCYTFPYDDQTSTFTCYDGAGPGTENYVNTQSCEFLFFFFSVFLRP